MKNAETVNDIIQINRDRVAGYEKAAKQSDDSDLDSLFKSFCQQSRNFIYEFFKK